MKPLFSVLTPSYKRGMYLPYVWTSLSSQTSKNFEWLVGIDGLNDDSVNIIAELAKRSTFPIKLVISDLHVGKSVIDNLLIQESRGQWILWCDSDDYLLGNCIEVLEYVVSIADSHLEPVYCMLSSQTQELTAIPDLARDSIPTRFGRFSDLMERHTRGDALICVRGNILRTERFPEVDFYCAEGVLWQRHDNDAALFIHLPLMVRRYLPDGISRTKQIQYPKSKCLVMQSNLLRYLEREDASTIKIAYYIAQICRFALHTANVKNCFFSLQESMRINLLVKLIAGVLGFVLYLIDKLSGKVIRTDLEFSRNYKDFRISRVNCNWS